MGTIRIFILFLSALVFGGITSANAADFLLINNQFTRVYTNSLSFTGTNGVSVTNVQGTAASIYHTFHFVYTATGTNTTTVAVDRTIDGQNWFIVVTNTLTASSITETNFTGKWVSYRFRVSFANTNAPTLTIPYIAQ